MTEFLLYGGKGGVGKTTCAAATALAAAESGRETLVVSTDPAHSLSDSLETDLGAEPTELRDRLWAAEIDPETQKDEYREILEALAKDLRSVGIRMDDEDVADVFSAGMPPGSDELAALDRLARYADDDRFDLIVLDTAPTGHTLRLLDLPEVMDTALEKTLSLRGQVRRLGDSARRVMLGPASYFGGSNRDDEDILALKERMEYARDALTDPDSTEFRVVLIPEAMAIAETERLVARLREYGMPVRSLVVNKVLEDVEEDCSRCRSRRDRHRERVAEIEALFPELEVRTLPEADDEVQGVDALGGIGERLS